MISSFGLELDARGNVKANEFDYRTSRPKVFAAGDIRRGQSLVVLGDPRGPAGRARHRQSADGPDGAAEVAGAA